MPQLKHSGKTHYSSTFLHRKPDGLCWEPSTFFKISSIVYYWRWVTLFCSDM